MASAGIYTTLLRNAGFTEQQWAMEVAMQADSANVMADSVRQWPADPGSALNIPKLSTFSAASKITKGAGGIEANSLATTTISDAYVPVTPVTAASKIMIPVTVEGELLSGRRAPMWEQAIRTRMGQALAKREELDLLNLYSGASNSVGDAAGYHCLIFSEEAFALGRWMGMRAQETFDGDLDAFRLNMYMDYGVATVFGAYAVDYVVGATAVSWDNFLAALNYLYANDAPGKITAVFHTSLYSQVIKVEEFWKASTVGDAVAGQVATTGRNLRPLGVEIKFSSNVVNA